MVTAQDIRAALSIVELAEAAEDGDIDRIMTLIDPSRWAILGEETRQALVEAGSETARRLPALPAPGGGRIRPAFRVGDPAVAAWLLEHSSRLIVQISETQRDAVREVLAIGAGEAGRNPRDVALGIVGVPGRDGVRRGGVVGLHRRFAAAVVAARAELSSGDPLQLAAYLRRGRRDDRYDALVRAAIGGAQLTAEQIGTITAAYADRLLELRGETIARTEAISALQVGRQQALRQVVDAGLLPEQAIVRRWDATGDERTRDDHADMDGQRRGLDEPFTLPDGSQLMYPTDSSLGAPPEQTIQCRCYVATEVDLRRLRDAA